MLAIIKDLVRASGEAGSEAAGYARAGAAQPPAMQLSPTLAARAPSCRPPSVRREWDADGTVTSLRLALAEIVVRGLFSRAVRALARWPGTHRANLTARPPRLQPSWRSPSHLHELCLRLLRWCTSAPMAGSVGGGAAVCRWMADVGAAHVSVFALRQVLRDVNRVFTAKGKGKKGKRKKGAAAQLTPASMPALQLKTDGGGRP